MRTPVTVEVLNSNDDSVEMFRFALERPRVIDGQSRRLSDFGIGASGSSGATVNRFV